MHIMIFYLLIIFFLFIFSVISYYKFEWALALLFLLLPTYLIRFNIGPIPTTLLESMIIIISIIWITQGGKDLIAKMKNIVFEYKFLSISILIFILAATISIFTSVNPIGALGEWKAFYIEPIVISLILITSIKNRSQLNLIITALLISGLITGIFAIIQQLTGGWMVPTAFWENNNSYRVTAWYGYPNGVGMYLAPMVSLAIYLVNEALNKILNLKRKNIFTILKDWWNKLIPKYNNYTDRTSWVKLMVGLFTPPIAILGVIFAKSTAAMVGITGAAGIMLLLYNQTRWWTIGVGIAFLSILVALPKSNPVKQELFFQNRSAQIRIDMWKETYWFLQDRPFLGAGIASYKERIIPYHQKRHIEIFHHPHNLFLTIWVNLGLLGLVGFIGILVWFFYYGISQLTNNRQSYITMFAVATMVLFLVFGLVDSPYIKNDMAILFWLPLVMLILNRTKLETEM